MYGFWILSKKEATVTDAIEPLCINGPFEFIDDESDDEKSVPTANGLVHSARLRDVRRDADMPELFYELETGRIGWDDEDIRIMMSECDQDKIVTSLRASY